MNWHDLNTTEKIQLNSYAKSFGWDISLASSENMIRFGKEIWNKQQTFCSINVYWDDEGTFYKVSTHRKNKREGRTHRTTTIKGLEVIVAYLVNPSLHPNEEPKRSKLSKRK